MARWERVRMAAGWEKKIWLFWGGFAFPQNPGDGGAAVSAPVTGLGRSLPTAGSERERGQGQGKGRRANSPPVGNNPDRNNTPNHRRINPKSESEPVFKPPGKQ